MNDPIRIMRVGSRFSAFPCDGCGVQQAETAGPEQEEGVLLHITLPLNLPRKRLSLCWQCALFVAGEVKIAEVEAFEGGKVVIHHHVKEYRK